MRRRPEEVPEGGVPADIAMGPHIPTWGDPAELARFNAWNSDDAADLEQVDYDPRNAFRTVLPPGWDAALSALRRWSVARRHWAATQPEPRKALKRVPLHDPYW